MLHAENCVQQTRAKGEDKKTILWQADFECHFILLLRWHWDAAVQT